jgi:hypothetical protein
MQFMMAWVAGILEILIPGRKPAKAVTEDHRAPVAPR